MSDTTIDTRGIPADRRAALRSYAVFLVEQHATDVEFVTISEMADQYFEAEDNETELLTNAEKRFVADLIGRAAVTVTWSAGVAE